MKLLRQLCSHLVGVYEMEDGIFEIDLIHHTAAQFIHQFAKKQGSEVLEILKPQALKELYRGNMGTWIFEKSPMSTSSLHRIRSQLFAGYGEYYEMAYGL